MRQAGRSRLIRNCLSRKGGTMVTPLDVACMQIIHAENRVDHAHYHLADPAREKPRPMLEAATFHLVDRNISMTQIGFDYYANLVTYRI